ncbi:MAG: UDP-N-acetylglucosamine 2-epimerase (non-hydrolyzing) [Candidatus Kapabacteria bacterium]|nr:UDP-N-acetylglucosamine 2-epimerase (non-hydrolyzing) [Candidatus Kapabacteria bacterium]MCS7301840.1 UDP-N-acetylglucosamine 2-epimerase (non-hydrolyzing) [Candidatus Kapabacteria bacterium]
MKRRILSVVGARPNFMKVAPIARACTAYAEYIEHAICHTGQHYDYTMSQAFFEDLDLPEPLFYLGVGSGSHAEQTARIMLAFEPICTEWKPDLVIVVGDVNSTIACTLVAVKLGIQTAHVEAGLRSFDRTMPEEINRVATDALCDWLFCTEQSGVDNLLREGASPDRVFFVGNTMIDSLLAAMPKVEACTIRQELGLSRGGYAVVTLHRPSNVDDPIQLAELLEVLSDLSQRMPVVFPVHPRTQSNIEQFGLSARVTKAKQLLLIPPQRYVHFVALVRDAALVLTDSGGIQEETTVLGVPCITLRTTTERPSTIEYGTNVLVPPKRERITAAIEEVLAASPRSHQIPPLWDGHAAERIVRIIAERCLGINCIA